MSLPVEFWEPEANQAFAEVFMPAMPRIGEIVTLQEGGKETALQVVNAGYYVHSTTSNKAWIVLQEISG